MVRNEAEIASRERPPVKDGFARRSFHATRRRR